VGAAKRMSVPDPRKLRRIACVLLLITLVLPFSRCSSTPPVGATTTPPAPTASLPEDPWYSVLIGKRGPSPYEYTYGYEIFLRSWELPTTAEPMLLIPGRMFHVWPFLAVFAVRWTRVRASQIGLYLAETVLAIGSMWWAYVATGGGTVLSGFYMAMCALVLYAVASIWDLVRETKGWRRERRADLSG
jgi:hypothetical protein